MARPMWSTIFSFLFLSGYVASNSVFESKTELLAAVDSYLANDETLPSITEKYGTIENWKVHKILNFAGLFNANRNPDARQFNANISRWNTSKAQWLHGMFKNATSFNGDLSSWDVSNVKQFNGMFEGASSFEGRGLTNWNVSRGELFMVMFADTISLSPELDVRFWEMSNAQNLEGMFRNSSFGSFSPQNDLCHWNQIIDSGANRFAMFLGSNCPKPMTPTTNDANPAHFCIECRQLSGPQFTMTRKAPPTTTTTTPQNPSPTTTTAPPRNPSVSDKKPNVLMIITDQQRFDTLRRVQDELWQYDNVTKIRTPNLDQLSQEGAYFRTAYCQCSVCAPARATLRTGCTVERTGIQHNDLTTEFVNSPLFTERVESLKGLDQVLVENGYTSEYYGKWHLPQRLWQSVSFNDFDYNNDEELFKDDSYGRKYRRFLAYHQGLGNISRALEDGMQYDTYGDYPYTPARLDSRFGRDTGTPLRPSSGIPGFRTGQPNVLGENKLGAEFTNSYHIAEMASKALDRMLEGDDPFFLTVSFHNPHPPMIPATKHLEYYRQEQDRLFVSHNLYHDMWNTDYGQIARREPKYQDRQIVQEWTALYYALIEEIDDLVGMLVDKLGEEKDDTLIIFTSDHGEMLGAHGKREKNNFFEEAARVPLFMTFPGRIAQGTTVDESVSHLDVFSTIMDYVGLSELDDSDGSSLRSFVEKKSYNKDFDESIAVAEWDFRKPIPTNTAILERAIDERPALMVRKGSYKLMMQKWAISKKVDMMYDLDTDPFEMNNLVGANAASASTVTIEKAEHLRCLLMEWMIRMDGGEKRYYSDPISNYGQGIGDIEELRWRQSWPSLNFWVSDSMVNMGAPVWNGTTYIRNEYIYMGTRTPGQLVIPRVYLTGNDKSFFKLESDGGLSDIVLAEQQCTRIKISLTTTNLDTLPASVDAEIVVQMDGLATRTISLSL